MATLANASGSAESGPPEGRGGRRNRTPGMGVPVGMGCAAVRGGPKRRARRDRMRQDQNQAGAWGVADAALGGERANQARCAEFCETEFELLCFPGESKVLVRGRGAVPVSTLAVGRELPVQVCCSKNNHVCYLLLCCWFGSCFQATRTIHYHSHASVIAWGIFGSVRYKSAQRLRLKRAELQPPFPVQALAWPESSSRPSVGAQRHVCWIRSWCPWAWTNTGASRKLRRRRRATQRRRRKLAKLPFLSRSPQSLWWIFLAPRSNGFND
eukprot:s6139_g5.t1